MSSESLIQTPFSCKGPSVPKDWIDYNGHMNVGYYLIAFDQGTDLFFDFIGVGNAYMQSTNCSTFTLESHLSFLRELRLDDPMKFTFQLIDHDRKRFHGFGRMYHAAEDYLAATIEWVTLHVDLSVRRGVEMSDEVYANFAEIKAAHDGLPTPSELGRTIGLNQKKLL